jgi:hypothetical protein
MTPSPRVGQGAVMNWARMLAYVTGTYFTLDALEFTATGRHSQPFSLKADRSTPGGAYQPSAP